ncbi:unnamed protein product, partial [Owenia fusiformis]
GCLIIFTTILTTLLIFIPKAIIIAKGGDPLSIKLFSPIGAAFGFLETVAGEGQMPGLGAAKSLNMPGVALAAGKIGRSNQGSDLSNAFHQHGKIGPVNEQSEHKSSLYKAYRWVPSP